MTSRQPPSKRWGSAAAIAAFLAWAALVAMIGISLTRPHDPNSNNGCLDICIAPPAWFVLDVLLTAIIVIASLVGLGTGWLAKKARPDGPGHQAWRASLAALVGVLLTWAVVIATGPHD